MTIIRISIINTEICISIPFFRFFPRTVAPIDSMLFLAQRCYSNLMSYKLTRININISSSFSTTFRNIHHTMAKLASTFLKLHISHLPTCLYNNSGIKCWSKHIITDKIYKISYFSLLVNGSFFHYPLLISPRILRILTGYYDSQCSSSFVVRRSSLFDVTLFSCPPMISLNG